MKQSHHFKTKTTMWFCSLTSSLSLPLVLLLMISSPNSVSSIAKKPPAEAQTKNVMLPAEAETLFSIMDSMSSDHNWRVSHPNPCNPGSTWPGLECKPGPDHHLHVSRLDFGSPPNPTCKPSSSFPYLIFSLPLLQSVFFFHCFTHTTASLSVSPTRLLNSSLQQLSLRANPALVGSIPSQISSLKSLQILTLSQNRLVGQIPVGVFNLRSLVHLDLSYNMLTGSIPPQLGNLKNLVGLDLSYNKLTGPIPTTIGQLGLLQKIDLSSNSLVGTIPGSIEKLSLLVFLALSSNQLRGNFPKGLVKLQNLQYFLMDDNPMFSPLPVELVMLVKLQELRLAGSGYSGSIPQGFSELRNLSTLSLQNNRLTGEIPGGFGELPHIYHLNLSRNLLDGVVPFNTTFFKRLGRNLDLGGNPGLCLSPSEAYAVKTGVSVCGRTNNGSVKKSHATSPNCSLLLFCVLGLIRTTLFTW